MTPQVLNINYDISSTTRSDQSEEYDTIYFEHLIFSIDWGSTNQNKALFLFSPQPTKSSSLQL